MNENGKEMNENAMISTNGDHFEVFFFFFISFFATINYKSIQFNRCAYVLHRRKNIFNCQ